MNAREVIAIDIGNSTARVGLVDCAGLRCLVRYECPITEATRRAAELAALAASGREAPIAVSSVVAALGPSSDMAKKLAVMGPIAWVGPDPNLPIVLAYSEPQTLGADRIADLLYCHAVHPAKPSIVIDAGTAITVDLLREDARHAGGVILPGIALQLRSLHRGTSALPEVSIDADVEFPGRSTPACIAAGVREGIAGGLSRIVASLQRQCGGAAKIFATGGAWKIVASWVDFAAVWVADLTLIGTALYCAYAQPLPDEGMQS